MLRNGKPLREAAENFPRKKGRLVHHNTLYRWVKKGVNGVRLTAWRIGATWYTSDEACEQFKRDCSAKFGVAPTQFSVQRSALKAQEELRKRGYGKTRAELHRLRQEAEAGQGAVQVLLPGGQVRNRDGEGEHRVVRGTSANPSKALST